MLELIIIVFVVFLFVRIIIIGRQLKGAHKRIDHIDETIGELKAIVGSPVSNQCVC